MNDDRKAVRINLKKFQKKKSPILICKMKNLNNVAEFMLILKLNKLVNYIDK